MSALHDQKLGTSKFCNGACSVHCQVHACAVISMALHVDGGGPADRGEPVSPANDLSERDVCTKFIAPALVAAGWDVQTQIREEVGFTKGRIIV